MTYSEYRRKRAEARELARARRRGDFDDHPDPDEQLAEMGVAERPCSDCGQPCHAIGEHPRCVECGPSDPRRWNK